MISSAAKCNAFPPAISLITPSPTWRISSRSRAAAPTAATWYETPPCVPSCPEVVGPCRLKVVLFQHLPVCRIVQGPCDTVLTDPPSQGIVAVACQGCAALLDLDQPAPAIVDQCSTLLIRAQVAIAIIGRCCRARDRRDLILRVVTACLRRAIAVDIAPVALGEQAAEGTCDGEASCGGEQDADPRAVSCLRGCLRLLQPRAVRRQAAAGHAELLPQGSLQRVLLPGSLAARRRRSGRGNLFETRRARDSFSLNARGVQFIIRWFRLFIISTHLRALQTTSPETPAQPGTPPTLPQP